MVKLSIILGSVRQGRSGERVAQWVMQAANQLPGLTAQLLDLKDISLSFYDEAKTPDQLGGKYSQPAAQLWHDNIIASDCLLFVTPEYNHAYPAVIKNAVDYLSEPWQGKPYAIVSYSTGAIGGARAAMQLRALLDYMGAQCRAELNMNFVTKTLQPDGTLLDAAWTERLSTLLTKLILNIE